MDPTQQTDESEEQLLNFDFGRYLTGLKKYAWVVLALMALAVTAAVIYTNRQPRIYQAAASIQIEPRLPDLLGPRQDYVLTSRASVGGADYYAQQTQVLASYRLIKQTVEQHRLYTRVLGEVERATMRVEQQIEAATGALRGMISVAYPEENRIMYVVVHSVDPKLAADVANAHVSTYIAYSKGLLSLDTKQASTALSAEFDIAESKLRGAETQVFKSQQDNDLISQSIEEKQGLMSSEITAYTTRFNESRAKRIELASRLDRMRAAMKSDDVLNSPILAMENSGAFDTLRAQYYSERNKFIELEKVYGPKNAQYQMQKAKMDDLYGALQSEAKRLIGGLEEEYKAALATENALRAEVTRATSESLALGPKVQKYNELLREKKSLEDRYNILRSRLSTTEISDRMSNNFDNTNVRPLDPALVPGVPVSPSLRRNIVAATALSLILGLGLVFLIVFLDRTIKSSSDAQQAAGAVVLGIIPVVDERGLPDNDEAARDLYVAKNPTSRVAECCRSLRTNILFSDADRAMKTIVVSSANPREGKTTSCIYLGTTMAQSGQKVLLIDTDMRRPRLHVSLGVSRTTGLSNLILGDRDYDDVIKTTDVPNLYVLPCGPLPPNPAELIMTQRFQEVLEELTKRFDRIILDSPPVQVVTDAVVLSKLPQADGVILVVHAGKTLRDDIKRSAKQMKTVGGNIRGVIVNAIEPDNRSGYYYSYYGYTEKEAEPSQSQA